MSGDPAIQVRLARLEQVLGERAALLEALERLGAGAARPSSAEGDQVRDLRERLTRLTREQTILVADLAALLPPDESPRTEPPSRRGRTFAQSR